MCEKCAPSVDGVIDRLTRQARNRLAGLAQHDGSDDTIRNHLPRTHPFTRLELESSKLDDIYSSRQLASGDVPRTMELLQSVNLSPRILKTLHTLDSEDALDTGAERFVHEVSLGDQLRLNAAGIITPGTQDALAKLIELDTDALECLELEADWLQPRCDRGRLLNLIEMNDRREFAAQFLTIQPVSDPLNRTSWTPSDKLLVELLSLGRCGNCRQRLGSMCSDWDMEHMLRVGCGGSNSFRNLQAMDTACHRAVKSKLDGTYRYPGSRDDHLEDAARAARCLGYSKHAEIFKIISS